MIDGLVRDIKHGMQLVLRQPGTALVVAVVLGLGIGVNTTVFTVANALLFQDPAGVRQPERLVRIHRREGDGTHRVLSYPQYTFLRERARAFDDLAAYAAGTIIMMRQTGAAEQAVASFATGNFFNLLGVRPGLGRWIQPDDDREGAALVAVLGHGMWQRAFGSNRDVIGTTVTVYGKPVTVVGVAPEEFRAAAVDAVPPDLWLPAWSRFQLLGRNRSDMIRTPGSVHTFLIGVGRLGDGVTLESAQAEVDAIGKQLAVAYPNEESGVRLTAVPHVALDPDRRSALISMMRLLSGIAFIVLAIACANLANLMLVRASTRAREVGVRLSLGATRLHLLRQFLSETLVLAVLGGGSGLLFSTWFADLLVRRLPLPGALAGQLALNPDLRVLGFATAVVVISAIAFGLAPAFHAARTEVADVLRGGTRVAEGSSRTRATLLVSQLALTLVLLIGAALLVRSVQQLRAVPIGFQTAGRLSAAINLRPHGYKPESAANFYAQLLERVSALPGVTSAALTDNTPMSGSRSTGHIDIEGVPTPAGAEGFEVLQSRVTPGYFNTLGIAVRRGRDFTNGDRPGSMPVVVVNEAFARLFWPGQDPVGKRINDDGWRTVVGVVADARMYSLFEQAEPLMFEPMLQNPALYMDVLIQTAGDASAMMPVIRREVGALDANVATSGIHALDDFYSQSLRRFTTNAALVASLGILALVLAVVGLYATVSFTVAQRTREIGVRVAVGAGRSDVLRLVFRGSLALSGAGILAGTALAFVATRAVRHWLYNVSPLEPIAFLIAIAVLVGAVLLATWLPARRALRVDPLIALRNE